MKAYFELVALLDKEIVSRKELKRILEDELVSTVRPCKPDKKFPDLPKFEVRVHKSMDEEIYWVYLKENILPELFKFFK